MITSIGKELKKLRVDREERLVDMAKKLNVSASFLSAVEMGKRPAPSTLLSKLGEGYDLDEGTMRKLTKMADGLRNEFKILASSPLEQETAGMLAREFTNLDETALKKLKELIKGATGRG